MKISDEEFQSALMEAQFKVIKKITENLLFSVKDRNFLDTMTIGEYREILTKYKDDAVNCLNRLNEKAPPPGDEEA